MRRILLAGAITAAVVSAAACDAVPRTSAGPTPAGPAPSVAAAAPSPSAATPIPDPSLDLVADTRRVCAEIDRSLDGEMRSFGADLGKMIALRQAGDSQRADRAKVGGQAKLRGMAARMRQRATTAQDAELQAAVQKAAANIDGTARNDAFFATFKSMQGVEGRLQKEVVRWLTPLTEPCAT